MLENIIEDKGNYGKYIIYIQIEIIYCVQLYTINEGTNLYKIFSNDGMSTYVDLVMI